MEDIEKLEAQLSAIQWEFRWCRERLVVLELAAREMGGKIEQVKSELVEKEGSKIPEKGQGE